MKKVLALLITLLFSTTLLTACGPAKEEGRYYYEGDIDFSIMIPESWSTSEDFMGTNLTAISPLEGSEDTFPESVAIFGQAMPMEVDLAQMKEASIASAGSLLENFVEVESGTTTVNGIDTIWYVYTYKMAGLNIKSIAYQMIVGNIAYVINGASTITDFDSHRVELEEIIQTFKVE